jgi:hypothetical protein
MPLFLAIGAGTGVLKSELVDRPREERQRRLAAATQKYSPWTGLKANPIQEADPLGSAIQFGATGAALGSNIESANAQNANLRAETDWYNRSKGYNNPWGNLRGTEYDPQIGPQFGGPADYNAQFRARSGLT